MTAASGEAEGHSGSGDHGKYISEFHKFIDPFRFVLMRSNAGSKFRMQRGCAIVLCKQT